MGRTKERVKIYHEPSIQEVLACLGSMPKYSEILSQKNQDKLYREFLSWLLQKDFYNAYNEKVTIKKMASDFKTASANITKWLNEIYKDILELNLEPGPYLLWWQVWLY